VTFGPLRSWSNALHPTALGLILTSPLTELPRNKPMSYTWGNQKRGHAKRTLILIRRILRPVDTIVPRSEIQYWMMIFVMLAVGTLLLATLLDTSPVF